MRIVLDGVSGVGKTYIGELLSDELDMNFIPYMPDFRDSELSIHREFITKRNLCDNVIVEGSLKMANFVKDWMYQQGYLEFSEYFKCKSLNVEHVDKDDIVVLIVDDHEVILNRRLERARPFEFNQEIIDTDLISLDHYLNKHYKHHIAHIVINRQNYKDNDSMIRDIIKQLTNLLVLK